MSAKEGGRVHMVTVVPKNAFTIGFTCPACSSCGEGQLIYLFYF